MRSPVVVKGLKRAESFLGVHLRGGAFKLQTLLIERAMEAFDVGILLRMMRITDLHLDAQTSAKAQQRGTKITTLRTADKACVAVQGDLAWHTPALHGMDQGFNHGFRRKVTA